MKRYRAVVAAVWMAVVTGAVLAGCSHQQARHQHKSAGDFTALYVKVTANALNDTRLCLAMLDSAKQTGDYPEEIITMIRGTLYCSVQDSAATIRATSFRCSPMPPSACGPVWNTKARR